MLTHEEMIGIQAEKHGLIDAGNFRTVEQYNLHLIHTFAYLQASILAENKTVLDLGCNTGYGSEILSNTAKRVVGVDVSEKAISYARSKYNNLGLDFQLIDGKRLPFEDNEFDFIISCQVIEHIVDCSAYLAEVRRVLSPSGIVLFTTPNALLRLDPGMKPWNEFHVHEYDHIELQSLLNSYFSSTQIMGLFAEESLYLIEKNRLKKNLETARKRQTLGYNYLYYIRSAVQRMLPDSMLRILRRLFVSNSPGNQNIDPRFIEEHGVEDLFYSTENLNIALDLLAICTDDESTLIDIKQKLKMDQ
ncbi:MAG: class I SAM-dependent methyltransferase [FCB group bacterium]|nr:class I SAM-dependent methyltransferase [FCB group bacterium]MBL7028467.1 class I SAM-dependent methyltransferase [Candidatus Neomarinimicrobiota bacterium]MBL7121531.1 class I SAM-dependent methyltransferase [Candidatus Neomarinimicrobiota bacterium]